MRNIRIIRPKRLESGGNKLQISVDGKKAGDLANGKEIVLPVDENEHVISGQGGFLVSKGFSFNFGIPSGSYSYTFQLDMVNAKNGYTPVLRPTDGQRLKDDVKVRSLMGAEIVQLLLKDETRAQLSPDTDIRVTMQDEKWQLTAEKDGQKSILLEEEYSSTKVLGVLLGAVASVVDKISYDTPEHRQETINHLFANYLGYLPDYEVIDGTALRFKG